MIIEKPVKIYGLNFPTATLASALLLIFVLFSGTFYKERKEIFPTILFTSILITMALGIINLFWCFIKGVIDESIPEHFWQIILISVFALTSPIWIIYLGMCIYGVF